MSKFTHEQRMEALKNWADNLAIRYLSPVYLCGSYLTNPETARDIDVFIVFTEKRWLRLFGELEFNDRQFKFRKKEKIEIEKWYIHDMDVDFKPVLIDRFADNKSDKLKLDRYIEYPI